MVTNRDRKSFGSRRKISKSCSDEWHRWSFWSAFRHFGTHFAESFRVSKSSWMMVPTSSREILSCSAIDLTKIRRFSKITSWILSIICGVVAVLGRPGRGASRVKKSPCLDWATQFLMVAYDGAFPLGVLSEWRQFPLRPCLAGKKNSIARVSMLLKSRASPDMLPLASVTRKDLQFGTWTDPPPFPKTLSIPSYDIGK